jgi:hypothetical protein
MLSELSKRSSAGGKPQNAEAVDECGVILLQLHVGGRKEIDVDPHRNLAVLEVDRCYQLGFLRRICG